MSHLKESNLHKKIDGLINKKDQQKTGKLEQKNGFKIIFISGNAYDMGFQYGSLLKEEYLQTRRAWLYCCENKLGINFSDLKKAWDKSKDNIPQEYKNEIQGRADALDLTFEEVVVIDFISMVSSKKETGCCGMAAWGPATSDGKLYHFRSQDFPLNAAIDPVTQKPAYESKLIVVRKPNKGFASIFLDSPCSLGVEGGFNEKGICLGWKISPCKDQTINGVPIAIRQLMVLDQASDLKKSTEIINSNRSIGCNVIISDSKKPDAVIIEQSANKSYVGTWEKNEETTAKFWGIKNVLRRTNIFVTAKLSETQKDVWFNPEKPLASITPLYLHYKALSKGIEKNWGKLNLNSSMNMLRSIYQGKTDIIFLFQCLLKRKETFNQWVACPKTGDFLFSFAHNKKSAYINPINNVNLFKLLKSV